MRLKVVKETDSMNEVGWVDIDLGVARRELLDLLDFALLDPHATIEVTVKVTPKNPNTHQSKQESGDL